MHLKHLCTNLKTFIFVIFVESLGILGHTAINCLTDLEVNGGRRIYLLNRSKKKSIWVHKSDFHCNVVLTALKAQSSQVWYLNSGCSRHMSGKKSLFTSLEKYNGGSVQFGGSMSKVIDKGFVNILGMFTPQNVFLVDGLKASLLSISQLWF